MAERVHQQRVTRREETPAAASATEATRQSVDYDAILDQIDAVLETDAEEYVRSFVQKGGQ